MSEVIDKIYKDLTKSQNQVGGTAWFTLEEAEVSTQMCWVDLVLLMDVVS